MIEFDGYLTDAAEKHFWKQTRLFSLKIFIFGLCVCLLPCIIRGIRTQSWLYFYMLCMCFAVITIFVFIPKSKKEKLSMTPKKIHIEDGYILCIADKYKDAILKIIDQITTNKHKP